MGGIQQLVKLAEERTTATTAAFATLALAVTSIIARLVGGKVFPRFALGRVITMLSFFQMIALAGLALSYNTWVFFAFILFFGATVGNILMLQPLLIAERFGVREYPKLFGRTQFFSVVGVAGGRGYSGGFTTLQAVMRLRISLPQACRLPEYLCSIWEGQQKTPLITPKVDRPSD